MRNLLLVSSSRVHDSGMLEHCRAAMAEHFKGVKRVLFVPYALADREKYTHVVSRAFEPIGIQVDSVHLSENPVRTVEEAEAIFVGGGNTFRLLLSLYSRFLLDPIRSAVQDRGVPYMGSSAGSNIACPSIRTSNDMPIVEPPSFDALNLVPFQINPHYIDADPNSTHKGETREQRLAEFLEENPMPVVGLREGSWLKVVGDQADLCGSTGMKLFRRKESPAEIESGDVSFLLGS